MEDTMKNKEMKRSLFSSVISLLLCFAMLIGNTFAWFTAVVKTEVNEIIVGNLDVELEYSLDLKDWKTVDTTTNLFKENALWSPGYCEIIYLKVKNVGDIELQYELSVNIAEETPGKNLKGDSFYLSDYIMAGRIDDVTGAYTSSDTAIADVLEAKVLSDFQVAKSGALTSGNDECFALVVYMPSDVGNGANYQLGTAAPQISLGIELFATQMENTIVDDTHEPDLQTEYYLKYNENDSYSFYTIAADGSIDYELTFTGSIDDDIKTVNIDKITGYSNDQIIIPAVVMSQPAIATYQLNNEEKYSVTINPQNSFSELRSANAEVFFVPIDGKKVSSITTTLTSMFAKCSKFTKIDLNGLDTNKVTNMGYMFEGCSGLIELDVSNFDTSNVTSMSSMFSGCSSLTTLNVSNFDTNNTTDMMSMFSDCSSLTTLNISNFDTSKATYMSHMFSGCKALTSLDVSGFDTKNVTNMEAMFSYCSNLIELDISGFDTNNLKSMFESCGNLASLKIPAGIMSIGNWTFHNNNNLKTIYYGGTAEEWSNIIIGAFNEVLNNATIYYYSETQPTDTGNYWHYVDGVPTPW